MGADKTGTARNQRIIKINLHIFPLIVNFPIQPGLTVNIYFISDKERFPLIVYREGRKAHRECHKSKQIDKSRDRIETLEGLVSDVIRANLLFLDFKAFKI